MNIIFSRTIGPIPISVVLREGHNSELSITENPTETGAKITDHAFISPKRLTLDFADENGAATYAALVRFQETRQPFTIVSGLSVYDNMVIKQLQADRDVGNANILAGRCELQEVIIVSTAYTSPEGEKPETSGQPGGKNSTKSARPSAERSSDAATKDRASGTVNRGDQGSARSVPSTENKSILRRAFGL